MRPSYGSTPFLSSILIFFSTGYTIAPAPPNFGGTFCAYIDSGRVEKSLEF
jgi:hypothetical protein